MVNRTLQSLNEALYIATLLTIPLGTPLTELKTIKRPGTADFESEQKLLKKAEPSRTERLTLKPTRKPAAIYFVRNRMFFARAAFNAKGGVSFGLRHIRKSAV